MSAGGFILKPFTVSLNYAGGFTQHTYYARSRGSATAAAWRDFTSAFDCSFRDFLRIARVSAADIKRGPPFGDAITVCGKPAFYVSHDRQYIQFVRPGSDVILNAHPLDVEPPVARKGAPYYNPEAPLRARAAE